MRAVLGQLFGLIQEAHERRPLLNNELSQKLAHGEVGLSLPGFMISIKQSTPTLKPRYPQSSTASPQPIHNLSVSPQTPLATKHGGGGQRDVHLSGVHTKVDIPDVSEAADMPRSFWQRARRRTANPAAVLSSAHTDAKMFVAVRRWVRAAKTTTLT